MNILYVTLSYPPRIGGGGNHLHCIAKEMTKLGQQTHVIIQWSRWRNDWLWGTTVFSDPPKKYIYEGIQVSQLRFPSSVRLQMLPWVIAYYGALHLLMGRSVRNISKMIQPFFRASANAPDIIHAIRSGREFLVQSALSYSRKKDIPFVLSPLNHPRWQGSLYMEYDRIYREADALIALTEYEKRMLIKEKGVLPERIHVTGIGPVVAESFSVNDFRATYKIHGPYVLFLGRQVKYKGYEALIRASRIVSSRFSDISFVFIGQETRQSKTIFKSFTNDRIFNLGPVDLNTKTAAIAGCEFLCMPSTQESFGGVYCEAWLFKKPVIGGLIPSIASVIDDEKDGLLCSQDPEELAERICYLLEHPDKAKKMGERGFKKVQRHYTWCQLAQKTFDVYKSFK